jgi:hypothetical protein
LKLTAERNKVTYMDNEIVLISELMVHFLWLFSSPPYVPYLI